MVLQKLGIDAHATSGGTIGTMKMPAPRGDFQRRRGDAICRRGERVS